MIKLQIIIKNILDFCIALLALIVLLPLFIIIGIAIKLDSKGPVFFKQKRLGKNGEAFKIIKFRTMVENAEYIGHGLSIKSESDSRITKVGRFLRKSSLDELPQLINIIKFEMSFVGPRPPVTYHPYDGIENYPEWAKDRFIFRPGITGLAQVVYRNSASWQERIRKDIEYIYNFSLMKDIRILIQTVKNVIASNNVY